MTLVLHEVVFLQARLYLHYAVFNTHLQHYGKKKTHLSVHFVHQWITN